MFPQSEIVPRKDVVSTSLRWNRYDKKVVDSKLASKFQHFRVIKNSYIENTMRVRYIFNIFGMNL